MRIVFSLLLASALGFGAEYTIDAAHSAAHFSIRHMMVSTVRGDFSKVTGKIVYDPNNLAASSVEASIDVSTVNTREPKRDAHLKSADFFDVEKFPTMNFQSTKWYKEGGKLKIAGNLTIHGVTKPVVLDVEGPSPEVKVNNAVRTGATATVTINRREFGLNYNRLIETGGLVVGDEANLTIDIEAIKKQ
jgi:polyisoprenoid-binding protein YceI